MRSCLPCALSLSRAIVAVLLFLHLPLSLGWCLAWAVFSDVFDGFLARLLHATSRVGAYLDPIADKLFALAFVLYVFQEHLLTPFAILALFARDLSLIAFWLYLLFSKKLSHWSVQSFILGKIATSLQFLAFAFVVFQYPIPEVLLYTLLLTGFGAFFELIWRQKR